MAETRKKNGTAKQNGTTRATGGTGKNGTGKKNSTAKLSNGKAASNASFEIFGVKDNGEGYETLEQFKGMKFYSHGIKKTDGTTDRRR
jgi:hypothetical protein